METNTIEKLIPHREIESKSGIIAEWKQLSQRLCEYYIAKTPTMQRNIRSANIHKLIKDLSAGKWKDTGQPIIISNTGQLIDGQHRMRAFLKSGIYPEILLISGVECFDGYKAIDTGAARTVADIFKAHGVKDYTNAAAITHRFLRIQDKSIGTREQYTAQELLAFYNQHMSDIVYWKGRHKELNELLPLTVRAAVSVYAEQYLSREFVENFWDSICNCIYKKSGAASLHRTLKVNANKMRGKLNMDDITSITLLAIVRERNNEPQKKLNIPRHVPYYH